MSDYNNGELIRLANENARLSALADRWNTECDEMREDNQRLAAELALGVALVERLSGELAKAELERDAYRAMAETEQRECTHDCSQGRGCTCQSPADR